MPKWKIMLLISKCGQVDVFPPALEFKINSWSCPWCQNSKILEKIVVSKNGFFLPFVSSFATSIEDVRPFQSDTLWKSRA